MEEISAAEGILKARCVDWIASLFCAPVMPDWSRHTLGTQEVALARNPHWNPPSHQYIRISYSTCDENYIGSAERCVEKHALKTVEADGGTMH
ncbi:unnamed protein product [Boreogadus saida]